MTRFSLRDVFWLTLVVGMSCSWWVHSWRLHQENTRIKEFAREHLTAAAAYYDSQAAWVRADADAAAMRMEIAELKQELADLRPPGPTLSHNAAPETELPRRPFRESSDDDSFQ